MKYIGILLALLTGLLITLSCGSWDNTRCPLKGEDCRDPGPQGPTGDTGAQGSIGPQGIYGPVGQPGSRGEKGNDGTQGSTGSTGAIGATGSTGAQGQTGSTGSTGSIGSTGSNGSNGVDGVSVVFDSTTVTACPNGGVTLFIAYDSNANGILDMTTDQGLRSTTICNGVNGLPGADAPPTPYTPTDVIRTCPDIVQPYREVLLRLGNGTILSSFSDNLAGANTRFAILPPGTYQNSDGSGCVFVVHPDQTVTW